MGLVKKNSVFKFKLKSNLDIIIVNLGTLVPGSGSPGSPYNFLNVTFQFIAPQNMVIATITTFLKKNHDKLMENA